GTTSFLFGRKENPGRPLRIFERPGKVPVGLCAESKIAGQQRVSGSSHQQQGPVKRKAHRPAKNEKIREKSLVKVARLFSFSSPDLTFPGEKLCKCDFHCTSLLKTLIFKPLKKSKLQNHVLNIPPA